MGVRTGTKSIPFQTMGSTAALTPAEGLDSPMTFYTQEGRQRSLPDRSCYTYHVHPQYVGLACGGATLQYWPSQECGLCSPNDLSIAASKRSFTSRDFDDISPLTPQSGVFPVCGYYLDTPVDPAWLYPDGSVILEVFDSIAALRTAYYRYYEVGDFSLPPPSANWYQDAYSVARRILRNYGQPPVKPQSGVYSNRDTHVVDGDKQQVLTHFEDDTRYIEDGYLLNRDPTFYNVDSDEVSVSKFLSRPVKIFSVLKTQNPTSLAPAVIIGPQLFFGNKRVVNRMTNYRNFKCDLCFKFVVNGSPFHYGRWMASVLPNPASDAFLPASYVTNAANQFPVIAAMSQLPHVFLSPNTSQGGCLRMPYVHHYNAFDITTVEHNNMGVVVLTELSILRNLSTTSDPLTISVFCWAENVVLGAPTQSNAFGMVPQSGDEYGIGVVSKPLGVAEKVAGLLSSSVMLRPYALASKQILTMARGVAVALGFSKPTIVSDVTYMCPRTNPNLSSVTQHDPIYKLAFDDKQEVVIDPSVVGLAGKDEMHIHSVIRREMFLTTFLWQSARSSDQILFYGLLNPSYHLFSGSPNAIVMSPMCYLGQLFTHWRGSIRFRFVAVASSFHRGRLRITYDPNGFSPSLPTTNGIEHNTCYNYIWDISENHECVIDFGYMSPQPYLEIYSPGKSGNPKLIDVTPMPHVANFDNGSFAVTVVNDLTAGASANPDIDILMFVSAGPDFEFANPDDKLESYSMFPQSGELASSGELLHDNIMPTIVSPNCVFGKYISDTDKAPMIHFGDAPVSLRSILKRYTQYMTYCIPGVGTGATNFINMKTSAFPLHRGKAPGGIHVAGGGPYNNVHNTPLAWISAMYFARRGGVRVRVRDCSVSGIAFSILRLMRNQASAAFGFIAAPLTLGNSSSVSKAFATQGVNGAFSGFSLASTIDGGRVQLDAEIPYHSSRRYFSPRRGDNSLGHDQGIRLTGLIHNSRPGTSDVFLAFFVSAADDYSLMGYVGPPPVYYTPNLL